MKPVYLTWEEIAVLKSLVGMALQYKDLVIFRDSLEPLHLKLYTALTETNQADDSNE